jgi:hypothetical protein
MDFVVYANNGKRTCTGDSSYSIHPSGALVVTDTEKGEVVTYGPQFWMTITQGLQSPPQKLS